MLKAGRGRPKSRSAGVASRRFVCVGWVLVFLLLIIPAAAILWGQRNVKEGSDVPGKRATGTTFMLHPRTSFSSEASSVQSFLRDRAGSNLGKNITRRSSDIFRSSAGREFIAAQGDAFLLTMASGIREGRLVSKGTSDGIRFLGPPAPGSSSQRMSDADILAALQASAGGSFRGFFATLFGKTQHQNGTDAFAEADEPTESNPFTEAKQKGLTDGLQTERQKASEPGTAEPTTSPKDEPGKNENPATPAAVGAVGVGSSLHSSIILHVGDDGTLQASGANRISNGTFETSQLGKLNFELLSFSDTADSPASIAVADFNNDGLPDVAYHYAPSGLLRFFYGKSEGTFEEGLRIETGRGQRSLAAGDFNGDGRTDIAISDVGTGSLAVHYRETQDEYDFKIYWLDSYRDYITAGGTGSAGVIGMNFSNTGSLLLDLSQSGGKSNAASFDFTPALDAKVINSQGGSIGLNAVLVGSSLSLNLTNRLRQLSNVLYVAPHSDVYIVVGDLDNNGRITIGIGTTHP